LRYKLLINNQFVSSKKHTLYVFAIFYGKLYIYKEGIWYKYGFLLHHRPMGRGGIPIRKGGSPAEKGCEPLL